jgi:hypothetical protein
MAGSSEHNLPQHTSLDELVEFFDDHDMGDYLEGMAEIEFAVDIRSRKHLIAIEQEIASKLTEIAKTEQVTAESLINSWLKERISNYPEEHKGTV